jgi:hypothetical protein
VPVTREQFAEYLEFLLNDSENDHDVPIPQRLCVAVLSLPEYLTEDEQPPLIPAPRSLLWHGWHTRSRSSATASRTAKRVARMGWKGGM